jgi:hypothetical protein
VLDWIQGEEFNCYEFESGGTEQKFSDSIWVCHIIVLAAAAVPGIAAELFEGGCARNSAARLLH